MFIEYRKRFRGYIIKIIFIANSARIFYNNRKNDYNKLKIISVEIEKI
jgi:hypothetical protein